MSRHLHRQIDHLKNMILQLGAKVETAVQQAATAVLTRNPKQAEQIIQSDETIDQMEIDIEEECLHTLALYQPVAQDLRYVVAVLKINSDLERIGDQAANMAEQVQSLSEREPVVVDGVDLERMTGEVRSMLKHSLDALVREDVAIAQFVRDSDDVVDDIHRRNYDSAEQWLNDHPEHGKQVILLTGISRQLERIADHAVNIAEDVLYMAEGRIFRHTTQRVAVGSDSEQPSNGSGGR